MTKFNNAYRPLPALLFCVLALAGCGGSSSGRSTDSADISSSPAPTISLSASPSSVSAGSTANVTWSSNNADSCEASGGWSGAKAGSGSQSVGPLQRSTDFTLSCSGAGGGAVRTVQVQVDQGNGVSVTLTASPENVAAGGSTTLNWTSSEATSCRASSGWSGDLALSGSQVVGPLSTDASYQLTCDGPSGSAVSMVTVRIADKTLRWQAPTQNVDGTPLTDLAGYKVYWGPSSRNYTGSIAINSPTTTQWVATVSPGEYYFALTALDSENNESGYSNEVLKLIP